MRLEVRPQPDRHRRPRGPRGGAGRSARDRGEALAILGRHCGERQSRVALGEVVALVELTAAGRDQAGPQRGVAACLLGPLGLREEHTVEVVDRRLDEAAGSTGQAPECVRPSNHRWSSLRSSRLWKSGAHGSSSSQCSGSGQTQRTGNQYWRIAGSAHSSGSAATSAALGTSSPASVSTHSAVHRRCSQPGARSVPVCSKRSSRRRSLVGAEPVEVDAVVEGDHELVRDLPQRRQERGDPRRGILGRDEDAEAQAETAATFAAWIGFCAPLRRASGSGASAPRSRSASR